MACAHVHVPIRACAPCLLETRHPSGLGFSLPSCLPFPFHCVSSPNSIHFAAPPVVQATLLPLAPRPSPLSPALIDGAVGSAKLLAPRTSTVAGRTRVGLHVPRLCQGLRLAVGDKPGESILNTFLIAAGHFWLSQLLFV